MIGKRRHLCCHAAGTSSKLMTSKYPEIEANSRLMVDTADEPESGLFV